MQQYFTAISTLPFIGFTQSNSSYTFTATPQIILRPYYFDAL